MQHLRCRFLATVLVERFAVRIERTVSVVEAHRLPDRDGVPRCEDASQVLPDKAWDEAGGPVYGGGLSSGPVRRIATSRRATLHALDAQTGKELWSSGNTIESWNHFSGLTVANGRAYIATFDGVLYCFGVAK